MTGFTAAGVAASMRGTLAAGAAGQEFNGVSIDTRTIAPGDLFVAIRGERFDGAEFAAAAIDAGAAGIVVPRGWSRSAKASADPSTSSGSAPSGVERVAVIEVDDTTAALQAMANAIRRDSGTTVVAITGSAGKTTTKELTGDVLAARYRVVKNKGNFNNHIGLPLSLVELRRRPEVAVVELGMNHTGEISTLVRIAEPEIRVWTNVGEAHLGFFASVDAIADAKAEIFEGATPDTLLVANADDERIVARLGSFAGRVMTFGIERDADIRATRVSDRGIEGTAADVATPKGSARLTLPLVGRGNLSNALAATAVAIEMGVELDTIVERLGKATPAPHRGQVLKLSSGVTVIDDSYNANPTATRRAIDVLAATPADRRIAVLGEMLELGDRSTALHEAVGRAAAEKGVDVLYTVGGEPAAAMAAAAEAAGIPRGAVRHFATSDEAAAAVAGETRHGDLVLVKGSRGVKTDRVVDRLKADRG